MSNEWQRKWKEVTVMLFESGRPIVTAFACRECGENIVRDVRNTKQECQPLRRDCHVMRIVVSGWPVLYVWQFATHCFKQQLDGNGTRCLAGKRQILFFKKNLLNILTI